MVETIFYDKARKSILDFFSLEFPDLALNEIETFIGFFYQMTNYEEEGTKIRPKIYICDNVNALTKLVPDCYKLAISKKHLEEAGIDEKDDLEAYVEGNKNKDNKWDLNIKILEKYLKNIMSYF